MKFIANKLKDKYKVYLFDRRCCGKSERNCTLTYEESAKGVYEFINKLNIDKPYLLGCSGGGTVALNANYEMIYSNIRTEYENHSSSIYVGANESVVLRKVA